jgi:glycosyltransferase involved in cell wall biosynthesis
MVRGGSERFVSSLAREQVKQGHEVAVVTLSPSPEPVPQEEDGILVYRIGHGSLFWFEDWPKYPAAIRYLNKLFSSWNPILLHRVRRIVESFRPDVMNTHCMVAFGVDSWKAATERGIPVVHALHELNLFCRNTNAFRDGHMCEGICLACRINEPKRWLSRHVSAAVGVSRDVLQRHLDVGFFGHLPPERLSVIWSMAPITPQTRKPLPKNAPFTIGFIGRIIPEKGLEKLLDAVAGLQRHDWRLLIAGKVFSPLDPEALRIRTKGMPIEWLGVVAAVEFYPQIDVLVVPAIWADPGPLVVHEAFASGVPVVGARIGGIMDMVEPGITGWLYDALDVTTLRDILSERIDAGRSALPSERNFERFRTETTAQRVAERYVNVYQEVIEDAQRHKEVRQQRPLPRNS